MESHEIYRLVPQFDRVVYPDFDSRYIETLLIECESAMEDELAPLLCELELIMDSIEKHDQFDIAGLFCLTVDQVRVECQISLVRLRHTVRCARELVKAGYRDSQAYRDRDEARRHYDLRVGQQRLLAIKYGLPVDTY